MQSELKVPDIGDFADVAVIEVLVKPGDVVTEGQHLIVVESDKATMDIPADEAGVIRELRVDVGHKVSQGSPIALIDSNRPEAQPTADASPVQPSAPEIRVAQPCAPVASSQTQPAEPPRKSPTDLPPYSSPSVRKIARELGIDLRDVVGTGPRQRITKGDITAHVKAAMRASAQAAPATGFPGLVPLPSLDFSKFGPTERKELPRIRKVSGANLHRNWVTIPHVTNHEEADVTELEALRIELNRENEKTGPRMSLLAFVLKACAAALKQFPDFNASLDGEHIILKRYVHIGFAADTPNGLVVPVIRDVDRKGVLEIAQEMSALAAKARAGQLSITDMSGGCFSVSSLGGIGGSFFTPIINAPEVAILGVGKARTQVMWRDGAPAPRLVLPLSLSWDHRVVDGAAAGRFNAQLARTLEDVRRLLL